MLKRLEIQVQQNKNQCLMVVNNKVASQNDLNTQ